MSNWIFIAAILILLLLIVALYYRMQAVIAQLQALISTQQQQITQLIEQLKLGKKATSALIDRVKIVEQKTRVGEMQLDQIAQKHTDEKNYTEAIKRVKNGADVDELVEHCHLLPNEAQLLIMMHGNKAT